MYSLHLLAHLLGALHSCSLCWLFKLPAEAAAVVALSISLSCVEASYGR